MTLQQVIQKAAAGGALDEEEKNMLKTFQPDERMRNEFEEMKSSCAALRQERDQAAGELAAMRKRQAVEKLAGQSNFADTDYLAFKLEQSGIAPDDAAAAQFIDGLKKECPRMFAVDIAPGSAAAGATAPGGEENSSVFTAPTDELVRRLEFAPEAF